MDDRERAILSERMKNEDEIIRLFEGEDIIQQQALREIRGWTAEQLNRLIHFAHKRKEAIDLCRLEYHTRKQQTIDEKRPQMSEDEKEIGVYWEQIEPQVRDAVHTLLKKGYWTIYSGFRSVDGDQEMGIENVRMDTLLLDGELEKKLHSIGFSFSRTPSSLHIRANQLASLDEIKKAWNIVVEALPDHPPRDRWKRPSWSKEDTEIEQALTRLEISIREFTPAYQFRSKLEELSEQDWNQMENCDSRDPNWTLEEVIAHRSANERGQQRDVNRIVEGLKQGDTLPAPMVLFRKGHPPFLIAGSTRLSVARAMGVQPKIFAIRL